MAFLEVVIRGLIVFCVLYVIARVLNKKLISQMTFFDFVAGITLGSMTSDTVLSSDLPLVKGIVGIILFATLVLIIDLLSVHSFRLRKVFNSEPTVLIDNGRILEQGMRKVRFTMDELLSQLRKKEVFFLSDVESAVLETDGSVSVLKKANRQNATPGDLNIIKPPKGLPQVVVIEGNVLDYSLKAIGKDRNWLKYTLQKHGIDQVSDVIVAQVDSAGAIYIDTKSDVTHFYPDE